MIAFLFYCGVLTHTFSTSSSFLLRDASWPVDLTTPFSYPTPSPIDIDSAKVRFFNISSPLQITTGQYYPYLLTNTGESLKLVTLKPDLACITGSILGFDTYYFEKFEYFWDGNFLGVASPKIDGCGTPLHVHVYWRNAKYNNNTAILHRDGYLLFYININVEGQTPSPLFQSFCQVFQQVNKPGSSFIQNFSLKSFFWMDQFFISDHYYVYPGSVGKYDCATIIQLPKSLSCQISISQFQVFLNMKNKHGRPLVRVPPSYSRNNRPIIEVRGVRQVFPKY